MQETALNTLIELAESQRQNALSQLGAAQLALTSHEQKLKLLKDYRKNYQTQLLQAIQQGVNSAQLSNQHQFMQSLDKAIIQQAQICQQNSDHKNQRAQNWRHTHRKVNALSTLQNRRKSVEDKKETRQQQIITDELALRKTNAHYQTNTLFTG